MPGKKGFIPKEKDLPIETLLAGVGLTVGQWETYLALLERPDLPPAELPDPSRATLELLAERGLLRPSLERELGYAPIPPGTAFSKLMERYDTELIQTMKAGMQLRTLMRGVAEARHDLAGAPDGSGIEVYDDINDARDRLYELTAATPGREQWVLETTYRPRLHQDDPSQPGQPLPVARANAPVSETPDDPALGTTIIDRPALQAYPVNETWDEAEARGETVLTYPGRLPQLILRDGSHLVLWRDPYPSREATLVITSGWALTLARAYVGLVVPLCEPWLRPGAAQPDAPLRERIASQLNRGLTDEQIALRFDLSPRTVGRHVAGLMEELDARTRFQAGVLLERRRLAARRIGEVPHP